ncbi:hypothetical protein FB451DRAFT_1172825 [Mycena latifolia]|nr:hypothetical protein FB451DRAFT_1172825 [Mycena latifolia]
MSELKMASTFLAFQPFAAVASTVGLHRSGKRILMHSRWCRMNGELSNGRVPVVWLECPPVMVCHRLCRLREGFGYADVIVKQAFKRCRRQLALLSDVGVNPRSRWMVLAAEGRV